MIKGIVKNLRGLVLRVAYLRESDEDQQFRLALLRLLDDVLGEL